MIALLVLAAVCLISGHALLDLACGRRRGWRRGGLYGATLDLTAGLLLLHLLLVTLQALGIRWTSLTVGCGLAALVIAATGGTSRLRGGFDDPRPPPAPIQKRHWQRYWRWGDAVAAVATLVFGAAAWTLRATHPDFIYHWGIKGKKFLLAGGVDFTYLSRPWNGFVHPDYPRLLPELYAVTSLPSGRFDEPVLLLWSGVFFAALLLALRESLRRCGAPEPERQIGLAFLALGLAGFALGHRLAGGADLPLAFAFAAALPVLLAERSGPADDLSLGLAAALAAASKIEGVPLAMTLCGVHLLRICGGRRLGAAACIRTLLPPLLMIGPWAAANLSHGLFQATNSGPFDPARAPEVLAELGSSLVVRHWHGLGLIVLAAPLLLLVRRTRGVAVVVLVQLAFDLWVYFTIAGDAGLTIRFSFPRLLLPWIPALVVAAIAALAGGEPDGASDHPS